MNLLNGLKDEKGQNKNKHFRHTTTLRKMPTNSKISWRGFWLCGLSKKKKIGGKNAFSRAKKASICQKMPYTVMYFNAFWSVG